MPVLPNNFHGSTTFSNRITSYDLLAQRIRRMLGEPLIQVEISNEQIYEIIDTACEYFTKFSGVTEEFLIFKSDLYIKNVGLPIGRLINITPDLKSSPNPDLAVFPLYYQQSEAFEFAGAYGEEFVINVGDGINKEFNLNHNLNDNTVLVQIFNNLNNENVYANVFVTSLSSITVKFNAVYPVDNFRVVIAKGKSGAKFTTNIGDGINVEYLVEHSFNSTNVLTQVYENSTGQIVYPSVTNVDSSHVLIKFNNAVALNRYRVAIISQEDVNPVYALTHVAGWDYDLNNFRKVVDVYSFAEGNNAGVNSLFTIEHTIAQQAYFGHLLGNVGYDLITWQSLKGWLETRERVLAMTPYLRFYPETQMLKIIPEPSTSSVYYGLVGCKLQKPIKDIVSQLWVYKYSLALSKIAIAHIRGKYAGSNLFGGQTVSYQDLMSQGIAERDKLETEITSDLIDRDPIRFFIG